MVDKFRVEADRNEWIDREPGRYHLVYGRYVAREVGLRIAIPVVHRVIIVGEMRKWYDPVVKVGSNILWAPGETVVMVGVAVSF